MVTVGDIMTKKVISLTSEDLVSTAISKMSHIGVHHIPVTEDGKYKGMIDYNLLFRRGTIAVSTKIKTIMERTPSIPPTMGIPEATRIMLDAGLTALAVTQKDVLKGIVTATDIVHSIDSIPEVGELSAGDIMSLEPITVKENDELEEASRKMKEIDEATIPVVDEKGKVTGMINVNDISRLLLKDGGRMRQGEYYRNKSKPLVKDVMMAPLTVKEDGKVSKCIGSMIKSETRVCTVVDKDMFPKGIISNSDILQEVIKGAESESVLVNLSGIRFEDPEVYETIYSLIEKSVKSIAKLKRMKPISINLHIEYYKQGGSEKKYSVRGKMTTESRTLFTHTWDWNIFRSVKELMHQFEIMAGKSKTKR